MPFTGDSSDDSSDGEDHHVGHHQLLHCTAPPTTSGHHSHNSHNSTSTDNTETSTSGSASSPSKSLKTSSSLSPAKRSGSESPKHPSKARGESIILSDFEWLLFFYCVLVCVLLRYPDSCFSYLFSYIYGFYL